MSDRRKPIPFEPNRSSDKSAGSARGTTGTAAIPKAVANRMARRVAVFTGLPTMASMGVFVGSYVLVTRGISDISPGLTLAVSGGFFLIGLAGLSYGVLSASWEPENGSLLGLENISTNIQRMRESIRAQKQEKSR
jgi:hypothetical protein